VADFIDTVAYRGHELHLENLTINTGSPLAGQILGRSGIITKPLYSR
jgi:hypothetical protein